VDVGKISQKIEFIIYIIKYITKMDQLTPLEKQYVDTLSEKERKAYEIAKEHLGMSFQLDKSVGYLKWLKIQESEKKS
jgi:hypothetical protein